MPLGYVIAQVTVTDPEAFEEYRLVGSRSCDALDLISAIGTVSDAALMAASPGHPRRSRRHPAPPCGSFQSSPKLLPAILVRAVTWGRARLLAGFPPRDNPRRGEAVPGSL